MNKLTKSIMPCVVGMLISAADYADDSEKELLQFYAEKIMENIFYIKELLYLLLYLSACIILGLIINKIKDEIQTAGEFAGFGIILLAFFYSFFTFIFSLFNLIFELFDKLSS